MSYAPGTLGLYTIYYDTRDYPGCFSVRRFIIANGRATPDRNILGTASTLPYARELIPQGLYNLGRQLDDDPVIVETWI